MKKICKNSLKKERGAAIIEMALTLPLLLLTSFGFLSAASAVQAMAALASIKETTRQQVTRSYYVQLGQGQAVDWNSYWNSQCQSLKISIENQLEEQTGDTPNEDFSVAVSLNNQYSPPQFITLSIVVSYQKGISSYLNFGLTENSLVYLPGLNSGINVNC